MTCYFYTRIRLKFATSGDDLRREMWVTDEAETPKKKKKKGTGYDMAMGLPGQMKVKLPELPPAQPGLPGRLFSTCMRLA